MAEIYEAPVSGVTVELTIDLNLQLAVENELNNVMDMYDAKGAMALAMDPNTGEILAISSKPSFDSNEYQNYNEEIINRNLPIWMIFEPGSTFKILTLSAALEEEVVNLFTDTYFDSGSIYNVNINVNELLFTATKPERSTVYIILQKKIFAKKKN